MQLQKKYALKESSLNLMSNPSITTVF